LRQQTGIEPLLFKRRYEQKVKRLRAVCVSKPEFIGGGEIIFYETGSNKEGWRKSSL